MESKQIGRSTGWAKINGRDEISLIVKVAYETEYLKRKSFLFDMKIFILTFAKVIGSHGVKH